MQPDETDWKIISILKEGYVPNNTIALELGVSEGTIRARLKKLKEAGILQIRALINPDVLENKQLVLVAMRVAESKLLDRKAEELSRLKNVLSVSIASGRYDLIPRSSSTRTGASCSSSPRNCPRSRVSSPPRVSSC